MAIRIDATSTVPPFEQVRSQIAAQVVGGELPTGTRLPTVRRLAAELGLAVNTVARAYRELEALGVVATRGRQGTFVTSDVLDAQAQGATSPTAELARSYARSAQRDGLTLAEALGLVERAWSL
jgi:DNA-binding transcriptional regulator YhcF (GntR family)